MIHLSFLFSPSGRPMQKLSGCWRTAAAAAAKSLQLCPTLYNPIDGSPPGAPIPGIQEHWTGLPLPSPLRTADYHKLNHILNPIATTISGILFLLEQIDMALVILYEDIDLGWASPGYTA